MINPLILFSVHALIFKHILLINVEKSSVFFGPQVQDLKKIPPEKNCQKRKKYQQCKKRYMNKNVLEFIFTCNYKVSGKLDHRRKDGFQHISSVIRSIIAIYIE